MSLPTYIRRRKTKDPVDFIVLNSSIDRRQIQRTLQLLGKWKKDYDGYYINPPKRHVRPFWLVPKLATEQSFTLAAAGVAGDSLKNVSFEIDTQGHFELASSMFTSTSPDFVVEIFDGGNNMKGLQNAEIHARTIAGTARRPFRWPETYFLNVQHAGRTMFMNFRNLSAAPNTIRWVFHGRRWYHKEASAEVQRAMEERFAMMEKTYTYFLTPKPLSPFTPEGANPPAVTLAIGQSLQENQAPIFEATDEADTEIHKLTAFSTGTYDWTLRELRSGRILSNGAVTNVSGWGDGEFPYVLPETLLIERNYDVAFEVTNTSGAENKIFATFTGRRLQYA